jgi:hypothetical protein
MPNTKQQINDAIERALDFVHPTAESAVSAAACEGAIANLGHDPGQFLAHTSLEHVGHRLFEGAFQALLSQCEDDEQESAVRAERRGFVQDVTMCLARVQDARLPLTVRNLRSAFLNEGPFAKKGGK